MDPSSSALSKSNLSLSMGLSTLPLPHMATKKWQGRSRIKNSEEDVSKEQGHSTRTSDIPPIKDKNTLLLKGYSPAAKLPSYDA